MRRQLTAFMKIVAYPLGMNVNGKEIHERNKELEEQLVECRAQLEARTEELVTQVRMQEAVAMLGQFALQRNAIAAVYDCAVRLSSEIYGGTPCALFKLSPDAKTLSVQASVNWSKDSIAETYKVDPSSHAGYAFLTRESVLFEDIQSETRFALSKGMAASGVRSGVAVVIGDHENKFGILALHSSQAHFFESEDLNFLERIANVVTSTVERNQFEAKLNASDRMATVGQLAAGVAHEVNNPLSYVTANVDMALAEIESLQAATLLDKKSSLVTMLQQVQEGIERVRIVVKDLTTFSRDSEDKLEPVHLESVIDSSIRMITNQIRHRAKLVKKVGPIPLVLANQGRLGQVILNLVINASQAIPEGSPSTNEIRIELSTDTSGRAVIEITDTGTGIPADVLPSIFDPFFTTKPIGVGTGLGLSICRNIILKMKGELRVESTFGFGTTVRIALPASENQIRSVASAVQPEVSQKTDLRRLKLLIIDDEELILEALGRGLSAVHEVTTCASPKKALQIIAEEKNEFDIIFCDLMMDELSGMDFYVQLQVLRPGYESKIIFMTGGVYTDHARTFLSEVPNSRLIKPFKLSEVRSLLQDDLSIRF